MRRLMIVCALLCAACQGERGPAGEDGEDGTDGEDGQTGPQGPMGEQGFAGPQGATGDTGPQGPSGPAGPMGADGARGPSGVPSSTSSSVGGGSNYRPSAYVRCAAQLDWLNGVTPGSDGQPESLVSYSIMKYSNDDVEVTCYAILGALESPQFSAYYPAPTAGAMSGPCSVISDYPPYPAAGAGSQGYWTVSLQMGVPTAAYTDDDPGHPLDGESFAFEDADCAAFVMDLGGKWYTSTLAEAL